MDGWYIGLVTAVYPINAKGGQKVQPAMSAGVAAPWAAQNAAYAPLFSARLLPTYDLWLTAASGAMVGPVLLACQDPEALLEQLKVALAQVLLQSSQGRSNVMACLIQHTQSGCMTYDGTCLDWSSICA